jgi:hypothetical protein
VLKRLPDRLPGFGKRRFVSGITIGRLGSCQNDVDVVVLTPGAPSTKFVNRTVMGDGEEPGEETPACGIELVGTGPEAHEDFLHHFLGGFVVSQESAGQRIDRTRIAVVDRFESGDVTLGDLPCKETI